jgi:hypothetical protein
MRDLSPLTVMPFLADEPAQRGGVEIIPCSCPEGGPCLGLKDAPSSLDPDFVIIVNSVGDAMAEPSFDPGMAGFEPSFFVTEEGLEEMEREEDRAQVEQLGEIIDNMVYIVGMYTGLVQDKVGD